jgi:hypothetical protein
MPSLSKNIHKFRRLILRPDRFETCCASAAHNFPDNGARWNKEPLNFVVLAIGGDAARD